MQTPKIEAYLPTDLQCLYWSKEMVYWAGRLWTFCSSSLANLISQVTAATFAYFASSSHPQPPQSVPLGKRKFTKEDLVEKDSIDNEENGVNLSLLFGSEEDLNAKDSPVAIKDQSQPSDALEEQEIEVVVNPISAGLSRQAEESDLHSGKKEAGGSESDKQEKVKEEPKAATEELPQVSRFTKFKRIRKKKEDLSSQSEEEPTSVKSGAQPPVTAKPLQQPRKIDDIKTEPIFYDNSGKGNCQLLSILKGLEMQYPERLKDPRKGQIGHLTAQKLRQIGVDFARQQIDTCGEYVEDILGYLDSDRREFNRSQIDPVERNMQKDRAKIERGFKSHKNKKLYEKQLKTHREKYGKLIDNLEKNVVIKTDENFLNCLEKDGFQCSTLHLYVLSIFLKLPIYVKEQKGIKGHDIQMFNPTDSTEEPIHLYRVADRHYQYMFYPKS